MNIFLEELKKQIEKSVEFVKLRKKSRDEKYTTVPVYLWAKPPETVNDYPYILIQGYRGQILRAHKKINVRIIVGVFNSEKEVNVAEYIGQDLDNILNRITKVIHQPEGIKGYAIEGPTDFYMGNPEEFNLQPIPLGNLQLETLWQKYEPKEEENYLNDK